MTSGEQGDKSDGTFTSRIIIGTVYQTKTKVVCVDTVYKVISVYVPCYSDIDKPVFRFCLRI